MDRQVAWAKRVWSAWVAGAVPEEVDEGITVMHEGVREVRGFLTGAGPAVLFVEGDHGDGKSHLVRWAVREARKNGQRAAYVVCTGRAGWNRARGLLLSGLEGWGIQLEELVWPGADMWFKLARVAKERFPDRFPPVERRFIYKLGVYAARGWALTEAQRKWAEEVVAEAVACDAVAELTELFREEVVGRCGSCPVWAIDEVNAALEATNAGWAVFATLGGIAELVSSGRLPFRLILAVTPEARSLLGTQLRLARENARVVRLPALSREEAASVVQVVQSIFRLVGGRSYRMEDRQVRQLLRNHPKRREFIQAVVQSLERAAGV